MKGDRALKEQAMMRNCASQPGILRVSADGREMQCPFCGRRWTVLGSHIGMHLSSDHGRAAGFVRSAANNHLSTCSRATPEERRAIARLDERRWKRSPPLQLVENDHAHPGYGNEPVWRQSEEG